MSTNHETEALWSDEGDGQATPVRSSRAPAAAGAPRRRMGLGQRAVVVLLLTVVLVPPAAGFYSYFSGIPLHLLAAKKQGSDDLAAAGPASITLVSGQAHTVDVPAEVCG